MLRLSRPYAGVDDRHEKTHRLARSRPRGDHEALVGAGLTDRLDLVTVELVGCIVLAKDLGGFGKDDALFGKRVRVGTVLEGRVQ
jgi:hypothetical protein